MMSDRAGLPTIGPCIWYLDPNAAIAWLERAFGFETRLVVDDGTGGVIHSELTLGDGYRARAAGARIEREPETQAYGDRVYTCRDLEDHPWSFGQTVQNLSLAEMAKATGHTIKT